MFLTFRMGSKKTLCAYCGVREAGWIPKNCVGPLCMEPDGECCYDRSRSLGKDVIVQERQVRLLNVRMALICSNMTTLPMPLQIPAIQVMIAECIWVAGYGSLELLEEYLGGIL